MIKLYERQNRSTTGVQTPNAPGPNFIQTDNTISNSLNYLASESAQMAQDSYILGRKEVLNNIVDQAYRLYPENSAKFTAAVQKSFRNAIKDLPNKMQMDAFNTINPMMDSYGLQIQNNIKTKQKRVLGQRASGLYDSSLAGMQNAYNNMIDANVSGSIYNMDGKLSNADAEKGKRSYQQQLLAHKQAYNKAKQEKYAAENTVDSDGNKVIRGGGDIDRVGAWKNRMWSMSQEELKQFDENHFRDRNAFMNAMDLDEKEYDKLDSYMKDLRKEWGDAREERKKSGADYVAMRLATSFDEDTAQALQKEYPSVFTDDFIKAMRNNDKVESKDLSTQMTDQDQAFLGQIGQLADLSKHRMEDTPQARADFWKLYGNTVNNVNLAREKLGATDDMKKAIDDITTGVASNQEFANALSKNLYDNTPIGREIKRVSERSAFNPMYYNSETRYDPSMKADIQDKQKIIASDGAKAIVMQAARLNTPEANTPEGKQQIMKDLEKTSTFYNRRLIAAQYKDYYAEQDLLEMQKKFEQNGTKSPVTINGITYKFAGFTNDGIVLEK